MSTAANPSYGEYGRCDRRRRAAALRCAPLPCGHRDPLAHRDDEPADRDALVDEVLAWRAAAAHLGGRGIVPARIRAAWRWVARDVLTLEAALREREAG